MDPSDQEQLLNELLSEIRDADRRLDAADIEARVMRAWQTTPAARHVRSYHVGSVVAAVLLAIVFFSSDRPALEPLPIVHAPVLLTGSVNKPIALPDDLPAARLPAAHSTVGRSRIAEAPVEFVPLMPLGERELTGSFQIVRVQMPRSSLGALTSPFEHPGEIVEADVLLGEDGMARAIRVSSSGARYPGRFR